MSAPVEVEERSDHDLLELITETGLCRVLRRPLAKEAVLVALAARAELIDRLQRWCWLTIEQAREAGATWAEVDVAAGMAPGGARREYHATLALQRRFGLVAADRADPGPREEPDEHDDSGEVTHS